MTKSVSCFAHPKDSMTFFNLVSIVRVGPDLILALALVLPTVESSFEKGRAEMIRATGAVLIASVLLYFCVATPA